MTPLRARLGRVGARLGPGTGGFFAWWGRSLAAWLPRQWRRTLGLERGRLLLAADPTGDDALLLRREDSEGVRTLGRVSLHEDPDETLGDLPRWLLLPAASGLRRQLALPAAAGDRLRDVLSFEIDRQTPFAANDVAFDARVVRRRADGQVDVELVVVPNARLHAHRSALGPVADTLAGIDVAATDGTPLGVNLLPPGQRRKVADPWRRWNLALAGVAILALVMGAWQVLDNRRDAADAFERELAPRVVQATQASAQRQALVAMVSGQAFLDRSRAARPTTVEILDEVTRLLPDGTWLEKVSIEGERLVLIGLSNEASALVRRLEASTLWRSPALTGAVQPDPRTGRDRFTLVAELATAPPAAPSTPEAARGAAR